MSQRKSRIIWDQSSDKTFLDACIHEVTTNGREGSALKPNSWKVVAEKLLKEHGLVVDQKQMRNHYDYYKGKYQAWVKLKSKTGNIYDPLTNKFNLTDEEWETETKLNKIVGALKNVPILFPELCTQLFEGTTSTGFDSWGPSSTLPRPTPEYTEHDFDEVQCAQTETPESTQHVAASEESSGHSKNKGVGGNKKGGGNKRNTRALQVEEEIIKFARTLVEQNKRSEMDKDIEACMDKLEKMGWGEEDERHKIALLLFSESADVRKVWLQLTPTTCESWVMSKGKKFGYL